MIVHLCSVFCVSPPAQHIVETGGATTAGGSELKALAPQSPVRLAASAPTQRTGAHLIGVIARVGRCVRAHTAHRLPNQAVIHFADERHSKPSARSGAPTN